MWRSEINSRKLTFRLAGINNQNFIMRDEETGSWWQQVTGRAIQGPMKGAQLDAVLHDELTFGLWKRERPGGRVLQPDPRFAAEYEPEDWEKKYAGMPVVTAVDHRDRIPPRTLVIGIELDGIARAYPFPALEKQRLILDQIGATPIMLLLADDGASVRAFDRRLQNTPLELFLQSLSAPSPLVDAQTGSSWDFSGKALSGPSAGASLRQLPLLKDYWFDWKLYHPSSTLYALGPSPLAP